MKEKTAYARKAELFIYGKPTTNHTRDSIGATKKRRWFVKNGLMNHIKKP